MRLIVDHTMNKYIFMTPFYLFIFVQQIVWPLYARYGHAYEGLKLLV